jgi:hypothetical protein
MRSHICDSRRGSPGLPRDATLPFLMATPSGAIGQEESVVFDGGAA